MTTPEFFLSLLCFAGLYLIYWGMCDRYDRRNAKTFTKLPDGDYYTGN